MALTSHTPGITSATPAPTTSVPRERAGTAHSRGFPRENEFPVVQLLQERENLPLPTPAHP